MKEECEHEKRFDMFSYTATDLLLHRLHYHH